ncbi:uncharacterized protein BJ171DRAFT_538061 [Polychytrium aggregatum]|uniref:uncharacterized protein n=1 Tax=Polychytrium aggregatum TaxID=110093 RepID=UPI0022FE5821|nr:uncharacterized protein BJ171DRAFT_538061 [Polychytrium aggregatum]KAI9192923.1 hypothetical protein BJ171DRAFT_538061 [Polychytrium aggregatum]
MLPPEVSDLDLQSIPKAAPSRESRIPVFRPARPSELAAHAASAPSTIPIQPPTNGSQDDHSVSTLSKRELWLASRAYRSWRQLVLTRRAQEFRQRSLQRDGFACWKARFASSSRESWKLAVRADVRHRFVLCDRAWAAWRAYVLLQRSEKLELGKALRFAEQRLIRTAYAGWLIYHLKRQRKQQLYRNASDFHRAAVCRRMFKTWAAEHHLHIKLQRDLRMGDQAYQKAIIARHLRAWKLRWTIQLKTTHKAELLRALISTNAKRRVWAAWVSYVEYQREKHARVSVAVHHHESRLLASTFHSMHSKAQRGQTIQDQMAVSDRRRHQSSLRHGFQLWRESTSKRQHMHRQLAQADQFYNQHIQKCVLFRMRAALVRQEGAERWNAQQLVSKFWKRWQDKVLEAAASREQARLLPAIHFYESRLAIRTLQRWKLEFATQRQQKQRLGMAVGLYRNRLLQRSLRQWNAKLQFQRQEYKTALIAQTWLRQNLISKCWMRWIECWIEKSYERQQMETAQRHDRKRLLYRGLLVFQRNLALIHELQQAEDLVAVQHSQNIARHVLRRWAQRAQHMRTWQLMEHAAAVYRRTTVLRYWFRGWIKRLLDHQKSSLKWDVAVSRDSKIRLRKNLYAWVDYTRDQNSFRRIVLAWTEHRNRHIQCQAFGLWMHRARQNREMQAIIDTAQSSVESELLRQTLRRWRIYTLHRAENKRRVNENLREAGILLGYSKLQRHFEAWRAYVESQKTVHMMKLEADSLYSSKLAVTYWGRWKLIYLHSAWVRMSNGRADEFRRKSLSRRAYGVWKKSRPDWHSVVDRLYSMPIEHWSLHLMSKCFSSWAAYIQQKKRYRAQKADVEMWRSERVLRNGCALWIEAVEGWDCQYEKMLISQQHDLGPTEWQLARKYALLWKAKTGLRASGRAPDGTKLLFQKISLALQDTGLNRVVGTHLGLAQESKPETGGDRSRFTTIYPPDTDSPRSAHLDPQDHSELGVGSVLVGVPAVARTASTRPQPRKPKFLLEPGCMFGKPVDAGTKDSVRIDHGSGDTCQTLVEPSTTQEQPGMHQGKTRESWESPARGALHSTHRVSGAPGTAEKATEPLVAVELGNSRAIGTEERLARTSLSRSQANSRSTQIGAQTKSLHFGNPSRCTTAAPLENQGPRTHGEEELAASHNQAGASSEQLEPRWGWVSPRREMADTHPSNTLGEAASVADGETRLLETRVTQIQKAKLQLQDDQETLRKLLQHINSTILTDMSGMNPNGPGADGRMRIQELGGLLDLQRKTQQNMSNHERAEEDLDRELSKCLGRLRQLGVTRVSLNR